MISVTLLLSVAIVCVYYAYRPSTISEEEKAPETLSQCYLYRGIPETYLLSEPIAKASDVPNSLKYAANHMEIMRLTRTPTGVEVLQRCGDQPIGTPSTYYVRINGYYLRISDGKTRFELSDIRDERAILNVDMHQASSTLYPSIRIRWNTYVLAEDLSVIQTNRTDDRLDYRFTLVDPAISSKFGFNHKLFVSSYNAPKSYGSRGSTELADYLIETPVLTHLGEQLRIEVTTTRPLLTLQGF